MKNLLDQSKAASLVKEVQPKQENIATPIVNKETTVFTPEMIRARVKSSFDANGYMDIKETSRGDKVILGAITKYIMATKGIVTNNQIFQINIFIFKGQYKLLICSKVSPYVISFSHTNNSIFKCIYKLLRKTSV